MRTRQKLERNPKFNNNFITSSGKRLISLFISVIMVLSVLIPTLAFDEAGHDDGDHSNVIVDYDDMITDYDNMIYDETTLDNGVIYAETAFDYEAVSYDVVDINATDIDIDEIIRQFLIQEGAYQEGVYHEDPSLVPIVNPPLDPDSDGQFLVRDSDGLFIYESVLIDYGLVPFNTRPRIFHPQNNAQVLIHHLRIQWDIVPNATSYTVTMRDLDRDVVVFSRVPPTGFASHMIDMDLFTVGHRYRVAVEAIQPGGSTWYEVHFTIIGGNVTVTFNGNGNTGGDPPPTMHIQTPNHRNPAIVPGRNTLVRNGFIFDDWRDIAGERWRPGQPFSWNVPITGTVPLTAAWIPEFFQVSPSSVDFSPTWTHPASFGISTNLPGTPTAWSPEPWLNVSPVQQGGFQWWTFTANPISVNNSPNTRHATIFVSLGGHQREINISQAGIPNVTLTFNGNGGTPASQEKTAPPGSPLGSDMPDTPIRANHTFLGWFTQLTGGTQFTSTTPVPNVHTPYWARWQFSPPPPPPYLRLDPNIERWYPAGTGQAIEILIDTNQPSWYPTSSDDSWITLDKIPGGESDRLIISASLNPSTVETRNGTVTITAGPLTHVINIHQSPGPHLGPGLTIIFASTGHDRGEVPLPQFIPALGLALIRNEGTLEKDGYTFVHWRDGGGNFHLTDRLSHNPTSVNRTITVHALWAPIRTIQYYIHANPSFDINDAILHTEAVKDVFFSNFGIRLERVGTRTEPDLNLRPGCIFLDRCWANENCNPAYCRTEVDCGHYHQWCGAGLDCKLLHHRSSLRLFEEGRVLPDEDAVFRFVDFAICHPTVNDGNHGLVGGLGEVGDRNHLGNDILATSFFGDFYVAPIVAHEIGHLLSGEDHRLHGCVMGTESIIDGWCSRCRTQILRTLNVLP